MFFINTGCSSILEIHQPIDTVMASDNLTTISIAPLQKTVALMQTFAVDVYVSNVSDLYAYEFRLTWNFSVIELQSAVRPSGHFLEPIIDPGNYFVPVWKINESRTDGMQTGHFGYTLIAPELARTGSGILARLTFKALNAGSTPVALIGTKLANDVGAPITHSSLDGLVIANPPLSIVILPYSVVMDAGQSQLFTSTVSGGTSPFAYQWYLNDTPVSGATNPTWTLVPPSAGSFTVHLEVNDNLGLQATSNQAAVTVNNALSVSISPTSVTLDVGQSQLFSSTISGGTSPIGYQWYLNDVAVSGATSATWSFSPSVTGFYDVYLNATDSVSFIAESNIAAVTVNPPPSATISPTSVIMNTSQSQLFMSSVANGTPPYTYQWHLNGTLVSGATSPTWSFAPLTPGTYYVTLEATDSVSGRAQSDAANITVIPDVHDIALTGITNSKSGCKPIPTIGQNGTLQICVTVHNLGDSRESFNVIVYANATEIQRKTITDLALDATIVLAFDWSTVGFIKGNYVISAYAEPVAGETNTTDNSFTGETVAVVTPGDMNADRIIDILDVVRVAVVFDMKYPHLDWDPNADLNNDGTIDIFDIATVAVHFGEVG